MLAKIVDDPIWWLVRSTQQETQPLPLPIDLNSEVV